MLDGCGALILDFDGTLMDSEPLHELALRRVLSPLGLEVASASVVGLPDVDAIRLIFTRASRPLDEAELLRLLEAKSMQARMLWLSGMASPYPGAVELLGAARARGLPVAVCTAATRREAEPVLDRLGVRAILSALVTADDVEKGKPDPACYRLTASRLGLVPGRCVAVEDSEAGVAAAVDAGCRVIAVGHTTATTRLGRAHRVVGRIGELLNELR